MKYRIYFVPSDRPVDGVAGLRMRVSTPTFVTTFNLGYRVSIADWNVEYQKLKPRTFHGKKKIPADKINKEIESWKEKVSEIIDRRDNVTLTQFRDAFKEATGSPIRDKANFFDRYEQFMKEQAIESGWSVSSSKKHRTMINIIKGFNSRITFDDFTEQGMQKLVNHIVNEVGRRNNTAQRDVKTVKWFLRWAHKKGYCRHEDYENYKFKLKTNKKRVVFLDWNELMTLYSYEFRTPYLTRTRDTFCFTCFTGLRYSDVKNLLKTDIINDRITFVANKQVEDLLTIELNKYAKAIYEKYKDTEGKKLFNVPSSKNYNDYIHEICKIVGFDTPITEVYMKGGSRIETTKPKHELLSSHSGRRTFICNALSLGIPPTTVMKWTGHSDFKSMQPYIDVAGMDKVSAMAKFDKGHSTENT